MSSRGVVRDYRNAQCGRFPDRAATLAHGWRNTRCSCTGDDGTIESEAAHGVGRHVPPTWQPVVRRPRRWTIRCHASPVVAATGSRRARLDAVCRDRCVAAGRSRVMDPNVTLVALLWIVASIGGIVVLLDWWSRRKDRHTSPRP